MHIVPCRWALQNPQLVAPVLLEYDFAVNLCSKQREHVKMIQKSTFEPVGPVRDGLPRYKNPLMASLTDNALIVSAAADMTASCSVGVSSAFCIL